MEETVIDQIEDETLKPVDEEAVAEIAEQETLEAAVDTPESSSESEEPTVPQESVDIAAIELEMPEAPESIDPDAEIAADESSATEPETAQAEPAAEPAVVQAANAPEPTVVEAVAEVGSEEPVSEPAASDSVVAADLIAADAIVAAAEADAAEAEAEEPVVPVEMLAWGFIDQNRKIHQNTTENYRGHVVGKAYDNPENQIAELESSFTQFVKEADLIEADAENAKNKVGVLGRIRKLKASAGRADALGDFDTLFARLRTLETRLVEEIEAKKLSKESLIARAEEIKESTDWRATGEAYKALFEEWKQVGATGKESDDSLWARFIGAREHFNQRRSQHFEQRQEQWGANAALKQELIVKAHELSTSDDWRPTSDALRNLFAEWKKVGSAGRQQDEELWKQFREAQQHFYDRRAAFYEDNKSRKEALAARAKELSGSEDWESTFEEMKAMMADWRTVGTAGNRDLDNKLWDAFRGAQNAFFDRRFESQAKREQEAREAVKGKEQLVSAIEALAYSGDPVAAQDEASRLKTEYDALPSIRKDRQDQLDRRLRKALGDIKVNAAAEGARRAVTWEGKIREALFKSKEQLDGLRNSVTANQEALTAAQTDLAAASGDEADLLRDTVSALQQSIADDNAEIDRLETSIADIESSLR